MSDNLTTEEIYERYGHRLTESNIKSLYPYEDGEFIKEEYSGQEYTVTYDPLTAYVLRQKYIVKVWGRKIRQYRAFVFLKPKPEMIF